MKKKIVILGMGSIGMRHFETFQKMSDVELIAVPKRQERREVLENKGIATAATLQDAVKWGAESCVVATDTSQHVSDCLSALELNLNVFVEKPLASDGKSGMELYWKSREKQKPLFVGCVLRFSESLNLFRNLLEKVGSIHSVRIECQSYLPDWRPNRPYQQSYSAKVDEGGVLRDLIHEIDYAGWLFGWPKTLQARLQNFKILNIQSEELVELSWENEKKFFVSIHLDYLSRIPRRIMRAYGNLGVLEWDGIDGKVVLQLANQEPQIYFTSQTKEEMFSKQAQGFLNHCANRVSGQSTSIEEAIKALNVCDTARISSQNHREEKVEYFV